MTRLNSKIAIAFSFILINTTQAGNATSSATSPISGIEVGKAKIISNDKLPSHLKKVVSDDLARDASAAGGDRDAIYEDVPEESTYIKNNYRGRVRIFTEQEKKKKFKTKFSDISHTQLQSYEFAGTLPEGPTESGPWSSMTRVYIRPDGVPVMLHEWDYVADGGGVVIVKELMNNKVNADGARFVKKKTPSGEVFSELTWVTKKKYFTLTVWSDVSENASDGHDLPWLLDLAKNVK